MNTTEKVALTHWRPHRKEQVRIWKGYDRESGTHSLETASEGISQDTERMRQREWHSRTRDRIIRDKLGHRKSMAERLVLTG